MEKRHAVTIDGPAGAGKTTAAKELAKCLRYQYLDTGAVYRAMALWNLRNPEYRPEESAEHIAAKIVDTQQRMLIDGVDVTDELRTEAVSDMSSRIAVNPEVRAAANDIIRNIAACYDVVMEGRDTGSAVLPNADVKFYLDADIAIRATRRMQQTPGQFQTLQDGIDALKIRDDRDMNRENDPLVQTDDMIYINGSKLTPMATVTLMLHYWHAAKLPH